MIISASRRTDIPAFYAGWFFDCIRQGRVLVKNPRNKNQVREISLKKENVDFIVFWTKNPDPIIPYLPLLRDYFYYFQFTLNSYGREIEPNIPETDFRLKVFRKLSKMLGPERVIFRYDPVILTEKYDINWHIDSFRKTARQLEGLTKRCVFSFLDVYKKNIGKLKNIGFKEINEKFILELAEIIASICEICGFEPMTCAEAQDLSELGIKKSKCVDSSLVRNLTGKDMSFSRDKSQRKECMCDESVDIGSYCTCPGNCVYCYAV